MKKITSYIVASALTIGALSFTATDSAYAHGGGGPGGGGHHKEKHYHHEQRHHKNNKVQAAYTHERKHNNRGPRQNQSINANRHQEAKILRAERERQQNAAKEAALQKQREAEALALKKQQEEAEALALKKQREAEALALKKQQEAEALELKKQQEEELKKRQEAEILRLKQLAEKKKKNKIIPISNNPQKTKWYEEVPEQYEGFLVSKVLNPERTYWADEKYYIYVKQNQALALADLLESNPTGTLGDYLGDIFLPFENSDTLSTVSVPENSNTTPVVEKIRALAEKGDVRITVFVKDNKVIIAKAGLWNGKYGFVKDNNKESLQYTTLLDAQ